MGAVVEYICKVRSKVRDSEVHYSCLKQILKEVDSIKYQVGKYSVGSFPRQEMGSVE